MSTDKRTNRNVFILGAGFSAPAGAPVINDFFDKARELFDNPASHLDVTDRRRFKSVFDFRGDMAAAREKIHLDLDNIEDLFGLVEMAQRLGDSTPETRDDTVYLIAKTLELAVLNKKRRSRVRFRL